MVNVKEKEMIRGWIALMEAVIGLAQRDLKSKSRSIRDDAKYFFNSEWYEEMKDICQMYQADYSGTNILI